MLERMFVILEIDFLKVAGILISGAGMSFKIFWMTLLFAVPLGMLVALGRLSKFKPLSWLLSLYILIMRGTPLMLQIIAVFFAVPMLTKNPPEFLVGYFANHPVESLNRFNAVIVAFSLNYAAYFAEIFRGGIQSISTGQYEASASLGFTKVQTFFKVVLPQVVKRVIPASSNEVIALVKDTSLAQVIGVTELFVKAKQQMNLYSSLTPLFISGLYYLAMCLVITILFSFVEKKLDYYK